jgi:quinol monooxygenase YgiN
MSWMSRDSGPNPTDGDRTASNRCQITQIVPDNDGKTVAVMRLPTVPTSMFITWLHFRAQPHKRPEILSAVDHLLLQMRQAPGCAHGKVLEETEDPNALVIIAEWESRDHVNAFLASSDFRIFRGVHTLLRGRPTVVLDEVRHRVSRLLT